ncbi:AI-2E family transporter [Kocuria palustris]|uniref:AI-2E family transporter n=1 Tax=Kocuria palustris TaxID=71999 RepID=UPI0021B2637A|nr:AI-2E family transporter [Kocuria palustris]
MNSEQSRPGAEGAQASPNPQRAVRGSHIAASEPALAQHPDAPELDVRPVEADAAGGVWRDAMGRAAGRSAQILIIGALAAAFVWLMITIQLAVIAALVALILATTVGPVVNALVRRGLPRWAGSAIVFVALILVVSAIISAVTATVMAEWDELSQQAAQGMGDVESMLTDPSIPIDSQLLTDLMSSAGSMLSSQAFVSTLFSSFGTAGSVLTGLILMLVMLFFFLKDGPKMWNFLLRWFHGEVRARMAETGDRTAEVLGGYVRGIVIVATVDATLIGLGLWVIGVPLALPLAVLCFLSAFIPIVGPFISGLFAALVALVTLGLPQALAVAALTIVVNNVDGNLLQPLIVGKSLSLHPLIVLTALTVGGLVGGIVGTILATPLTAVAWSVIQIWSDRYQSGEDPVLGRDPVDPETSAARRATLAERWRYQAMRLQPIRHGSRGATATDAATGQLLPAAEPPAEPLEDPVSEWPVHQPDGGTPRADARSAQFGDLGAEAPWIASDPAQDGPAPDGTDRSGSA